MDSAQQQFLQLDGERSVSFKDRGQAFVYHFRRISDQDWRKFFARIRVESERAGEARTDRVDLRSAELSLVSDCLLRVEGYVTSSGAPISPEWKRALPYGHRIKAAELLEEVTVSICEDEFVLDPDFQQVSLDAAWGMGAPGSMTGYRGLVHKFNRPDRDQETRYTRAASETRVIGDGRAGRTLFVNRQAMLADLYDELIAEVDGYGVGGQKLSGAENIRREMDLFHKVAAAQQLFAIPA